MASAMEDLQNKVDTKIKMSPVVNHSGCKATTPCRATPTPPRTGASNSHLQPSPKDFHGFAHSDVTSTAAPDNLLHYLMTRDPNIGVGCNTAVPGIHQYTEPVPSPPAGSHVHHIYVDDKDCLHDANYVYRQSGAPDIEDEAESSTSGEEEEEIRVKERRETVVTRAKKRKEGRPPGTKSKYPRKF